MATVVLFGLLWHAGVELYVDDLLVYGSSFEEFITRLRDVFARFRLRNITANPTKCELGLTASRVRRVRDESKGLYPL